MPQDFPGDYFMVLARCKQFFDVMDVESALGFSWEALNPDAYVYPNTIILWYRPYFRCKQIFDVIDVESAPGFSWGLFYGTGQMQTIF